MRFIAIYAGTSPADAKMLALSADPDLVAYIASHIAGNTTAPKSGVKKSRSQSTPSLRVMTGGLDEQADDRT